MSERHILGIGIGFTLMDIILLIYKRKDKKEKIILFIFYFE